jgi:hypothetical protein
MIANPQLYENRALRRYYTNMANKLTILILIASLCHIMRLSSLSSSASREADQKIIENPEKPIGKNAGRVIWLEEVKRITEGQGGYYFKFPYRIKISPDNNIFVEDEFQLLKFDQNGRFQGNYFKKGQGPNELLLISDYIFKDNNLVIYDRSLDKILVMGQDGKVIGGHKIRAPGSKTFLTVYKDQYYFFKSDPPDTRGTLKILEVNENLISVSADSEFAEKRFAFPLSYMIIKSNDRSFIDARSKLLTCLNDDESFFISNTNTYEIKLFNLERNEVIRKFSRKYKRVKVSSDTKKWAHGGNYGRVSIGDTFFEVPVAEYHDDVQKIALADNELWVFTSTVDKKKGILVDVYNFKGQYIDNFYLEYPDQIAPLRIDLWIKAIAGNYVYTVEQDEKGMYAIVKSKIVDNTLK